MQIPPVNPALRQNLASSSYREANPIEVYTLPDAANLSIPPEIRNQFQQDDAGRILFFTAPPVHLADHGTGKQGKSGIGHSVRYLAAKSRNAEEVARKRKAYEAAKSEAQATKRKLQLESETSTQEELARIKKRAFEVLENTLASAIRDDMKSFYGDQWAERMDTDIERLATAQKETMAKHKTIEEHELARSYGYRVPLGSAGTLLDDTES